MTRKKTIFIVAPAQLFDNQIEQVNELKIFYNVHLLVLIKEESSGTILRFENTIPPGLYDYERIRTNISKSNILDKYFEGLVDVKICVFSKSSLYYNLKLNLKIYSTLGKANPTLCLIDDISGLFSSFALIAILNYRVILSVHDPVPHSGERRYFDFILRFYRSISHSILLYSEYAKFEFIKNTKRTKNVYATKLLPYNIYKEIKSDNKVVINRNRVEFTFLFFGRISKYKGLEELIEEFDKLINEGYKIRLIIAGTGDYKFHIPKRLLKDGSIVHINRYIHPEEVGSLISQADSLVCPYRDATQSGVLMTAAPFNVKIISSNVGAFPEYKEIIGEKLICYDILEKNSLYRSMKLVINNRSIVENNNKEYNNNEYSLNKIINKIMY
jgi:glycosyltransferase involved in cell wall biosynthesis